jgi:hypothetical protein
VSAVSAFARFHGAVNTLTDRALDRLLDLEPGRHEAVIAEDETGIVAVARYVRDPDQPTVADFAVLVADEHQRSGLARRITIDLAALARQAGIDRFRANVVPSNSAARGLVLNLSPNAIQRHVDAEIVYLLDLNEMLRP